MHKSFSYIFNYLSKRRNQLLQSCYSLSQLIAPPNRCLFLKQNLSNYKQWKIIHKDRFQNSHILSLFSLLFFVGSLSILLMIGDVFLLLQTSFSWILGWVVGCCLYQMQTSFFLNSPYTGYKRSKNAGNITQQSFGEPLDLSGNWQLRNHQYGLGSSGLRNQ